MLTLNERREPLDFVTLVDELERAGQLEEVGGPAYLTDLISSTPTAIYVDHYARIVERTAVLRRLISAAGKIAELAYDESQDVDEVVDRAEQIIFGVSESRIHRDLMPIRAIMADVVERIDFLTRNRDTLMGVPTGFTMLDKHAGRPAKERPDHPCRPARHGQNARLALEHRPKRGPPQQCPRRHLQPGDEQRAVGAASALDGNRHRQPPAAHGRCLRGRMADPAGGRQQLACHPIFIDDTPAASVTDMRTKARRLYAEHGLDLIIIDYMQLMSGQHRRAQRKPPAGNQLHQPLAQGVGARTQRPGHCALSQLTRAVEARSDKRPMLSDLRESGSIEQDADVVLFIYREDYYVEDSDRQNIADVLIAKHRHGSTGTVSLFFRKELTQFRDLEIQRAELDY